MGLWGQIKGYLDETFSIQQFMELLGMDRTDKREARNVLHQLYIAGIETLQEARVKKGEQAEKTRP